MQKIPLAIKYFLLMLIGLGIIVCCSLFQQIPTVTGEYHYSHFIDKNYTIPAATIFFIVSMSIGYYWRLNPWLSGLCLFFIFPLTSVIEGLVYQGSHNLIPFEFIGFFIFSLPSVIGVYIGKIIYKQIAKRKRRTHETSQENIPLVKNDTMKVKQFRHKKIVIILTSIAFAFAIYTQIVWAVVAANNSRAQQDAVQLFLHYFPPFLRDIAAITYATLLCSIIVVILSSVWRKKDSGINKVIATIILVITILILLLTLFQLM